MHQMRISTTQVSSMVLRPKKLEIREKKFWKLQQPKKPNARRDAFSLIELEMQELNYDTGDFGPTLIPTYIYLGSWNLQLW
jgi:hypothetical protein